MRRTVAKGRLFFNICQHSSAEVVQGVLADAGNYLGLALANLANLLSPSRMVLGGSLATLAEFLLPAARPIYEENALAVVRRHVEITISELGERAVPMGGIALALEHFLENAIG